jgi:hypothetical protein
LGILTFKAARTVTIFQMTLALFAYAGCKNANKKSHNKDLYEIQENRQGQGSLVFVTTPQLDKTDAFKDLETDIADAKVIAHMVEIPFSVHYKTTANYLLTKFVDDIVLKSEPNDTVFVSLNSHGSKIGFVPDISNTVVTLTEILSALEKKWTTKQGSSQRLKRLVIDVTACYAGLQRNDFTGLTQTLARDILIFYPVKGNVGAYGYNEQPSMLKYLLSGDLKSTNDIVTLHTKPKKFTTLDESSNRQEIEVEPFLDVFPKEDREKILLEPLVSNVDKVLQETGLKNLSKLGYQVESIPAGTNATKKTVCMVNLRRASGQRFIWCPQLQVSQWVKVKAEQIPQWGDEIQQMDAIIGFSGNKKSILAWKPGPVMSASDAAAVSRQFLHYWAESKTHGLFVSTSKSNLSPQNVSAIIDVGIIDQIADLEVRANQNQRFSPYNMIIQDCKNTTRSPLFYDAVNRTIIFCSAQLSTLNRDVLSRVLGPSFFDSRVHDQLTNALANGFANWDSSSFQLHETEVPAFLKLAQAFNQSEASKSLHDCAESKGLFFLLRKNIVDATPSPNTAVQSMGGGYAVTPNSDFGTREFLGAMSTLSGKCSGP